MTGATYAAEEPMRETGTVLVERASPGIAIVRLNRPAQLNALNAAMFAELRSASDRLQSDQDVRAIVLTGSGRGFCAGYDLDEAQELAGLSPAGMLARQDLAQACVLALRHLPQPVIAAVKGPAMGGGLCLALAADFRIASQSARFSAAFIRLGLSAGDMGCSWLLPRVIGSGHAAELMFTGAAIDAAEAARIGLANRVVADEALLAESLAVAEVIAGHSAFAMGISKRALHASLAAPSLELALELEARGQAYATRGADFPAALAGIRTQVRR
jgi:enoyl-CoA hydratase/carnithine racemase